MQNPLSTSIENLKKQLAGLEQMQSQIQSISSKPTETAITGQQKMLLDLYDEFVTTDEGKALASNLQRFARFAQSKLHREPPDEK